jgi:hypothetical protein
VSALLFAADENLNERLLLALLRRLSSLDIPRVRSTPVAGGTDDEVLAWAAAEGRIVITHDEKTMPPAAWERVSRGMEMPGVVVVPGDAPSRAAVEQLTLLAGAGGPEDTRDRVLFLPTRG